MTVKGEKRPCDVIECGRGLNCVRVCVCVVLIDADHMAGTDGDKKNMAGAVVNN